MGILDKLKLEETKNTDELDAVELTLLHKKILAKKPFLSNLYRDFYAEFKLAIPELSGPRILIELGSGGGFIKEIIPETITSDILPISGIDKHFSAVDMPFKNNSVDAIFMINVLHHIPTPRAFFKEAARCLKKGGRVIMIEPANTWFGRFIYQNFHREKFDPSSKWEFNSTDPLLSANGAIPWIIFRRDIDIFKKEFPDLKIDRIKTHTPLRYLLSGGFSLQQLAPSGAYSLIKGLEFLVSPLNSLLGMFMTIKLRKT